MTTSKKILFLLAACACSALTCSAQQAAASKAQSSGTASANSGAPQPDQGISPRASAAILQGFSYAPPPPPKPVSEDEEVDLRDVDKPKNGIVRLPKYTVTAKKPTVFTDRSLYSSEELKKLAMSRYLSSLDKGLLNKWTVPGLGMSNEQRAMQEYLADERLKNMADMQQDISTLNATGNTGRASETKTQYYDMYLRARDDIHTDTLTRQQGK